MATHIANICKIDKATMKWLIISVVVYYHSVQRKLERNHGIYNGRYSKQNQQNSLRQ